MMFHKHVWYQFFYFNTSYKFMLSNRQKLVKSLHNRIVNWNVFLDYTRLIYHKMSTNAHIKRIVLRVQILHRVSYIDHNSYITVLSFLCFAQNAQSYVPLNGLMVWPLDRTIRSDSGQSGPKTGRLDSTSKYTQQNANIYTWSIKSG